MVNGVEEIVLRACLLGGCFCVTTCIIHTRKMNGYIWPHEPSNLLIEHDNVMTS